MDGQPTPVGAHVRRIGDASGAARDQPGCTIDHVIGSRGERYQNGSGKYAVSVDVAPWSAGDDTTYRVEVYCR